MRVWRWIGVVVAAMNFAWFVYSVMMFEPCPLNLVVGWVVFSELPPREKKP